MANLLSDDDDSCSSHSFLSEDDCLPSNKPAHYKSRSSLTHASTLADAIIHLDVDAFYCQCEELSNPDLSSRPFAIGQKHIIVTCNYVARARGVKKLMLRTKAKQICPELIIIEGSDLEPYRRQARRIYNSFRKTVAALPGGSDNLAKKGGMDEMYADISAAVNWVMDNEDCVTPPNTDEDIFVYDDDSSKKISITEDQSGNSTSASFGRDTDARDRWGNSIERETCLKGLKIAAKFANTIRLAVKRETGFRACAGVSTSPMLAKIASELRKPNSLNVLYPWRASSIIDVMPLRKIPGLGSRTLRSLEFCLKEHNARSPGEESYWTCSDLLRVPRSAVVSSCGEAQSDILLQRCRGIDPFRIVDDLGGLTKTVSVEDSFRRSTVTTLDGVLNALEELYHRLPRLLDDRRSDSDRPDLAFPTTIRFSARVVDGNMRNKRLPFVTNSRQCGFDGRKIMMECDENKRSALLRGAIRPLMTQILLNNEALDVTKLNIAVTGFADIGLQESGSGPRQKAVTQFFSSGKGKQKVSPARKESIRSPSLPVTAPMKRKAKTTLDTMFQSTGRKVAKATKGGNPTYLEPPSAAASLETSNIPERNSANVDPSFLAALPPDIRAEVAAAHGIKLPQSTVKKKSGRKIDSYFRK